MVIKFHQLINLDEDHIVTNMDNSNQIWLTIPHYT